MITLTNIQECKSDAVEVLWQLMLERPAFANISHDGKADRSRHLQHVLYHPHREWCLIADADTSKWVGGIYITHRDEIGIGILSEHQRKGFARQAIEAMMQRHRKDCYYANVAPGNHPSHRMWESFANHAIVQVTYRIERGAGNGTSEGGTRGA